MTALHESTVRCLVTGGAGFIGSHLCQAMLQSGCQVCIVDNLQTGCIDNVPAGAVFERGDICDRTALRRVFQEFRPHWVCHQAAQASVSRSMRDPAEDARSNIEGLLAVLEECRLSCVQRIVAASTGGALYGDVQHPASEDWPAAPRSAYGISKWAGEQYLRMYAREYGLRTIVLRYANVYGPRQDASGETGVLAAFCAALLAGRPVTILGDGQIVRDFVYVDDVIQATRRALESPARDGMDVFNVGTGVGTTLWDAVHLVARLIEECVALTARPPLPEQLIQLGPPRPGDLRASLLNCQKIHERLGWSPRWDLMSGLRETLAWYASRNEQLAGRKSLPHC